jgi:hypothetical protein
MYVSTDGSLLLPLHAAGGLRRGHLMPPRRGTPGVATFAAASGILSVKRGCPR